MQLTEEQRVLVREKLARLAVEHARKTDMLRKEYEAERKRLETMLRHGVPEPAYRRPADENANYRRDMKDAGRGHLLR